MVKNKIIYYEKLDSTNQKADELAREGAAHGTVVVAREQTAGRGRRGRNWSSPSGDIYMSMIVRPRVDASKASMLTLVMAYSVAKVIQKLGYADVSIKWPNDLLLSGKKVCGILTEMHMEGQEISHVVVGVGVNVNSQEFPAELKEKATSLYAESGKRVECDTIVKDIAERFTNEYEKFIVAGDLAELQQEYNELLINCGKEVRVLEPGNEYTAYAVGINELGELVVQTEDGTEQYVFAGEVSVRGVDGYI